MKINLSLAGRKLSFTLFERRVDVYTAAGLGTLSSLPPELLTEEALTNTERGLAPIHIAATCGCLDQIPAERLTPAVISAPSTENLNALHYAARSGTLHQVPYSLLKPELLNDRRHTNWTPLHEIAARREIGLVPAEFLIPAVLGRQFTDGNGISHLGHLATLVPPKSVLRTAPRSDFMSVIEICVRNGTVAAIPPAVLTPELMNSHRCGVGQTVMHIVAETGRWNAVPSELVTESTAFLEDAHGRTPLHYAARAGKLREVPTKLFTSKSVMHGDDWGDTPLHYAALAGHISFMPKEFLTRTNLSAMAETARAPGTRKTSYHYLATSGSLGLLPGGTLDSTDMRRRDSEGNTPLHDAAAANTIHLVPEIIEVEDRRLRDKKGQTFEDIAERAGRGALAESWARRAVDASRTAKRTAEVGRYSMPADPQGSFVSGEGVERVI
jgi:ankyrin repeat protein